MPTLIVNIHIKADRVEAFREATLENARNSRKEPGIVRFEVLQAKELAWLEMPRCERRTDDDFDDGRRQTIDRVDDGQ